MKKVFYICMVACLALFGFASCGPEGLVDNTPVTGQPEVDAAGTYVGTWTRILDKDTTTAEGTVVLAPDTTYIVNVEVAAASAVGLSKMASVANIAQDSHYGTKFNNNTSASGFGTSFTGRTYTNANNETEMFLTFKKMVKSGRKSYEYNFTFVGVKQAE